MLRHVALQIEQRRRRCPEEDPGEAERAAVRALRAHLLWYTRGRQGGIRFRREADSLDTATAVAEALDRHFPAGGDAFEPDPGAPPVAAEA